MSFQQKLASGNFMVLAEADPPKGVDISGLITHARRLKDRIDAVVVPDMDNGVMRLSALAAAVILQQQGLETLIHVYGRDRNRMALQADLLGAHVLGIRNLIVVRGEAMANGDHRDAALVDDLDELGLLRAAQSLQEGIDLSGFALKGSPTFTVGCTLAPWSDEPGLERELAAAAQKIAVGARFVITPAVFDLEHFDRLLDKAKPLGVPLFATVFVLKSVGIARYIAINEPGAGMSEKTIRRIRQAPDRETECLRIAGETISALKGRIQGVKIVTMGWENRLPAILDYAGF